MCLFVSQFSCVPLFLQLSAHTECWSPATCSLQCFLFFFSHWLCFFVHVFSAVGCYFCSCLCPVQSSVLSSFVVLLLINCLDFTPCTLVSPALGPTSASPNKITEDSLNKYNYLNIFWMPYWLNISACYHEFKCILVRISLSHQTLWCFNGLNHVNFLAPEIICFIQGNVKGIIMLF